MNTQECLQILRDVRDAAFATVDEKGLPQVRMIDVMLVENEKFYFCTARGKDFYAQLMRDNHVAITAMNQDFQMVRLSGTVEKLAEQKAWIDRIFEENPGMNSVYPNESRYILEPFCVANATIEFFDLGKEPINREGFTIGRQKEQKKGFEISRPASNAEHVKKSARSNVSVQEIRSRSIKIIASTAVCVLKIVL